MLSGLLMAACKTNKPVAANTKAEPNDAELSAVRARYPEATMDVLKQGHGIYYGACTRCHGAKDVTGYTEDKLKTVVDKMASKAKLSDTEKDAVWKYALAVNLSTRK